MCIRDSYYAIGQCTPGVIAVNVSTFVGNKLAGISGGIAATLGFSNHLLLFLIFLHEMCIRDRVIKHGDGGWGISPRSAIGQRKDGTVLFLVVDGRQPGYSIGATLADMQNIMYKQGAYIAANLDGGSSTTLYYNGKVVNKPADLLGERMIPTSFIVK